MLSRIVTRNVASCLVQARSRSKLVVLPSQVRFNRFFRLQSHRCFHISTKACAVKEYVQPKLSEPLWQIHDVLPEQEYEQTLQRIKKMASSVGYGNENVNPDRVLQDAKRLKTMLVPTVLASLAQRYSDNKLDERTTCNDIALIFLRCGMIEEADWLLRSVTNGGVHFSFAYNTLWSTFIKNDDKRERIIQDRKPDAQSDEFWEHFSLNGPSGTLIYLSASVAKAINTHEIAPTVRTLCNIMLATLRMLPAPLKQLRQSATRKLSPSQVSRINKKISELDDNNELLPPIELSYIPKLETSTYMRTAPDPMRIPIPIEASNIIAAKALDPIWKYIKLSIDTIRLAELTILLRAFRSSTLVRPLLFLVNALPKFQGKDNYKMLAECYEDVLTTLLDDVRYEEFYDIYTSHIRLTPTQLASWVCVHPPLFSIILQGVSRAPKATREERERLFEMASRHQVLTPEALSSYFFAMSRDGTVSSLELYHMHMQVKDLNFKGHQLAYMNHVLAGYSYRGSYHLAFNLLTDMWEQNALIASNTLIDLLLSAVYAQQTELTFKLLDFMTPTPMINLRSQELTATRKSQPIRILPPSYIAPELFRFAISYGNEKLIEKLVHLYCDESKLQFESDVLPYMITALYRNPAMIDTVLRIVTERNGSLRIEHYNSIISMNAQTSNAEAAQEWFDKIRTAGLQPNEESYTALVRAYGKHRLGEVFDVMQQMQEHGVQATPLIYNQAIALSPPDKAEWLLADMRSKKIYPTMDTYARLLSTMLEADNKQMFMMRAKDAVETTGLPLTTDICRVLVRGFARFKELNSIVDWLLPLMTREKVQSTTAFHSELISAFYHLGRDDIAENSVKTIAGSLKNSKEYSKFVNKVMMSSIVVLAPDFNRMKRMVEFMQLTAGLPVSQPIYAVFVQAIAGETRRSHRHEIEAWLSSQLHPMELEAIKWTATKLEIEKEDK